jgi:hypothetical protein
MGRRVTFVVVLMAATLGLTATAAFASLHATSGTGHTAADNPFGFTAKSDLSGQLEYQFTLNGTTYDVHCMGYDSYVETTTSNGKYPKTIVTSSNCFDQFGTQYIVRGEFVDRGEPGTRDSAFISVKSYPDNTLLYKDGGRIKDGDIQILS